MQETCTTSAFCCGPDIVFDRSCEAYVLLRVHDSHEVEMNGGDVSYTRFVLDPVAFYRGVFLLSRLGPTFLPQRTEGDLQLMI